jgi:hypothetical protein
MAKHSLHEVRELLAGVPKIDVHTHLSADRLMARGLDDILLYHMVNSELYSAGAPEGSRVPEERGEEQAEARIEQAVPYLPRIRNTALYATVRLILRDLYGWEEEITPENWRALHRLIREANRDDGHRARSVLQTLGIRKAGTELTRRADGRADDLLQYALEWAFFARVQWGQPDASLYELERAWSATSYQKPLPVTAHREERPVVKCSIRKPEDIREAVTHYCGLLPYERILATAQHLSTDIDYHRPSYEEVAAALQRRELAGDRERDVYASAILYAFLEELEGFGDRIVFQFSLGAEALPFESAARLRQRTIGQLAELVAAFPGLRFMCLNASRHGHQALCTLVRELPNLSLAGFWWHSFFPGALRQLAEERLDMVPLNRQCDYLTDAYSVDWVYGKNRLILDAYAHVFAQKLEAGQYRLPDVESIARGIFYQTPVELLGFQA